MAEKTLKLTWDGYYPEDKKDGALLQISKHKCSGIYAVYAGEPTTTGCSIRKLLYIGESYDVVGYRLTDDHDCYKCWKKQLKDGEKLYFSITDISPKEDRERAEEALIYKLCPPCNEKCTESFNHDKTTIESSGDNQHKFIPDTFTVYRTA